MVSVFVWREREGESSGRVTGEFVFRHSSFTNVGVLVRLSDAYKCTSVFLSLVSRGLTRFFLTELFVQLTVVGFWDSWVRLFQARNQLSCKPLPRSVRVTAKVQWCTGSREN